MKRLLFIVISIWVCMGFPTSHPITTTGGYTGAPQDSFCTTCHRSQNEDLLGDADILGIPPVVFKNERYPLSIKVRSQNAFRAGFQMVALEQDLSNGGELVNISSSSNRKVAGGKRYIGHNPAILFQNDTLATWKADWLIEENDMGTLTLYLAAMLGSGDQGNNNDRAIFKSYSTELRDSTEAVWATIDKITHPSCENAADGIVSIRDYGGVYPLIYQWNTGDTTAVIDSIKTGKYYFTITDAVNNSFKDSVLINANPFIINRVRSTTTDNQTFTLEIQGIAQEIGTTFHYKNLDLMESGTSMDSIIKHLPPGNYEVFVSNESGCTSDTITHILNLSTSNSYQEYPGIVVYPNPASQQIFLKNKTLFDQVKVYDLAGSRQSILTFQNETADVSFLVPGVYLLSFWNNGTQISINKLVIQ